MTDMQSSDQVVSDYGSEQRGVNTTTQAVADPVTGATTRRTTTRAWSGRSPGVEFVWLIVGIVVAFLAFDFVLHATGANSVGFAAFVFSVGKALAAPFAGIFKTTYATRGSLLVWADVLAMFVYALLGMVITKIVMMATARGATRA
jgi:hypothetical protein